MHNVGGFMNLLSLFSGCGGMDIGFEGDFICLKKSINALIHSDWVESENGDWVKVKKTIFNTVFANDIRKDAKAAWVSYISRKKANGNTLRELIVPVANITSLVTSETTL